jgi:hypothetical protein
VLNAERAWLVRFKGEYESNIAEHMLNAAYARAKGEKLPSLEKLNADFDEEILEINNEINQLFIELEENEQEKATES